MAAPQEAIVLAALKIAAGFLEDETRGMRWWAEYVADGALVEREVEVTVRSILMDVEYDLCGIGEQVAVERKRRLMFRGCEEGGGNMVGLLTPESTSPL